MRQPFSDGCRFSVWASVAAVPVLILLAACSGESLKSQGVRTGGICKASSDCESAFCVDGICCESACEGVCQTCATEGVAGKCLPADVGTDPREQCEDEGVEACGQDGTCDGSGQCRRYPIGTICGQGSCVASALIAASRCSTGSGCMAAEPQTCAPFVCGVSASCLTTCTSDQDCTAPSICLNGSCGKKPLGDQCADNAQCNSGFCQQGVCCNADCSSTCRSCALEGSVGTCTTIPPGQDPLNQCAAAAATSCGLDGSCNGDGACRFFAATTTCGAASCTGSTRTPPALCDGAGACRMSTVSCGTYACGADAACRTTCTDNAHCTTPSVCNGGSCGGLKAQYYDIIYFDSAEQQNPGLAPALTRTDPFIDFTWAGAPPNVPIGGDTFSVRWTGKVTPPLTGMYTFYLLSDDGDRLWVNNLVTPIIDHWSSHDASVEDQSLTPMMLTGGRAYDIKVEFFDNTMGARIRLRWSRAAMGNQAALAAQVIPTEYLTPAP